MRTKLVETPRPERYIHVVFNAEATAQIPRGTPCILNLSQVPQPATASDSYPAGYQDGLQVVLPSSSSATLSNYLLYGVALANITAQQLGESQVHGLVNFALINLGTRASSTAAWASAAAIASGALLVVDSTNNGFVTTSALSAGQQHAILIDSIASVASSASTSTDTRVANLQGYRVFVRQM